MSQVNAENAPVKKEYIVADKMEIISAGKTKTAGEKVMLNERQAKALKASGHIK